MKPFITSFFAVLLVGLLLIVLPLYVWKTRPSDTTSLTRPTSYTAADVAIASTTARCFASIEDSVYDLTPVVHRQPALVDLCGSDASDAIRRLNADTAILDALRIGSLAR